MKRYGMAVIGLGVVGRRMLEQAAASAGIQVVSAWDAAAPVRAAAAADFPGLPLAASAADGIERLDVDVVYVAVPPLAHAPLVRAAVAAGKAVFCEKPLALNLEDARAMIDACRRAKVPMGVGHLRRFWPSTEAVKQAIVAGEIGELLHVEGHFSNEHSNNVVGGWRESPAESPAAGLTGAGLHIVDAFTLLVGPALSVHAHVVERKPPPAPLDTIAALYRLDAGGGRQVSGMFASVRASPLYWRIHAFGSRGSVEALGEHEVVRHASGVAPVRTTLPPREAMRHQLEAFARAVRGEAEYPIPFSDLLATVASFEATVKSVETSRTIEVTRT